MTRPPRRSTPSANACSGRWRTTPRRWNGWTASRTHGQGIAPEDQQRIFEQFERAGDVTQVPGLGLGLFISHQIVQAHGGRLELRSTPGEGAEFTLCLPVAGAAA